MKRWLAVLLLCAPAFGATHYVTKSGTDSGTCTLGSPCLTITYGVSQLAGGDTLIVSAGTYNESVTVPSGVAGTPISYTTLQVNGTDVVNVLGFTMTNYTKVVGFHIANTSSPTTKCITLGNTATYMWIQGNTMTACGGPGPANSTGTPTHVYFGGNTVSYLSTATTSNVGTGIQMRGEYWLIESNDFSHLSDAASLYGSHVVYRNNNLHDFLSSECTVGGNGGNCHIDAAQTETTSAAKYILAEGNYGANNQGGSGNGHGFLMQADVCPAPTAGDPYPCSVYILRENALLHFVQSSILDDNGLHYNNNMGFSFVKSYQNTWVDFNYGGTSGSITSAYTHCSFYPSDLNNIYYYPETVGASGLNPYVTDTTSTCGTAPTVQSTAAYGNNLAWCSTDNSTQASPCTLYNYQYSTGHQVFTADTGNQIANPLFTAYTPGSTSYSANNFQIQSGSPAKNAGRAMTTVASGDSGSGTALIVNDCTYFQDGWNMTDFGVQPDWIRVGASTTVQISSIDYSTYQKNISSGCTITLKNGISRSVGDGVYLYNDSNGKRVLYSANGDLGAFPYAPPDSPSVLTFHASGLGSSTANGFNTADNNIICTYNGSSLSCSPGPSANYANSTAFTVNVTAAAGSAITSVTISAPLGSGTCTQNSITNWTCSGNVGTGNADVTATFIVVPTCALSVSANSITLGQSLTITPTLGNLSGSWSWTVFDPTGAQIYACTSVTCPSNPTGLAFAFTPSISNGSGLYSVTANNGQSCSATQPINISAPQSGSIAR